MKTKNVIFKNMGEDIEESAFSKTFMNKTALLKRISNTRMLNSDNGFTIIDWKAEDKSLLISYSFQDTMFGEVLIGSTAKGICFIGFTNGSREEAFADLKRRFAVNPKKSEVTDAHLVSVSRMNNPEDDVQVKFHLKGSAYQLAVWKQLLHVPFGGLITYSELAGDAASARAAGTAVAANPIAYLLPCHRVIRSDGTFDGFFWGTELKRKLLTYEAATTINEIIELGFSNSFIMAHYNQN